MNQQIANTYHSDLLPKEHVAYLRSIESISPKVIYDIGSNVLHWHRRAKQVWPAARFICFDALVELAPLYEGIDFVNCVLSDRPNKEVEFFFSYRFSGGSSYYKENSAVNKQADAIYTQSRILTTTTLDLEVENRSLPFADLIKMDVQGAELDVIKGAPDCLTNAKDIIIELQEVEYNRGAPRAPEVIDYMKSIGFRCVKPKFALNRFDADYHFKNERFE